jgi:hypothetical protein
LPESDHFVHGFLINKIEYLVRGKKEERNCDFLSTSDELKEMKQTLKC